LSSLLSPFVCSLVRTDVSIREFIVTDYPWFISTFDSYRHNIQRVDAGRYFILYHFGGVYLDCDVGCRTQIGFFRYQGYKALFPVTSPIGVSNDVMFATAKHPFFSFVIHQLERYTTHLIRLFCVKTCLNGSFCAIRYNSNWIFKYPTVMFSTGPAFLSHMLYLYGFQNRDASIVAFIDTVTYTEGSFFHVEGSSWHGWDAILVFVSSVVQSVLSVHAVTFAHLCIFCGQYCWTYRRIILIVVALASATAFCSARKDMLLNGCRPYRRRKLKAPKSESDEEINIQNADDGHKSTA
jgi:mannosyltransferase OCH1-like enzyme